MPETRLFLSRAQGDEKPLSLSRLEWSGRQPVWLRKAAVIAAQTGPNKRMVKGQAIRL